mgnify:CR=1 FL=1
MFSALFPTFFEQLLKIIKAFFVKIGYFSGVKWESKITRISI